MDLQLADLARRDTGRKILCGDFRTLALPQPTALIGNPPFKSKLIADFLERSRQLLPDEGRCGFILPAFVMNYEQTVNRWRESFSMDVKVLPRTLYTGLQEGLLFVIFTRNKLRLMHGMALYDEQPEIRGMAKWARLILVNGKPGRATWWALVEEALQRAGGTAHLTEIYECVEPRRTGVGRFWKEKVRQVLQYHAQSKGGGVWALQRTE